jgi:flagellar biosynthesis chaperone FliJ
MVVELKTYSSADAIAETLDEQVSQSKSVLGEYLRRLDEIRQLAERSKKIREVVLKMAGKTKSAQESLGEINIGNLDVVLDANPFHELTAIEEAVRSQQDRLLVLQKAREALKWMDQIGTAEGLTYLVLERDGIPEKIMLKIN